jgi:hypothetical protein
MNICNRINVLTMTVLIIASQMAFGDKAQTGPQTNTVPRLPQQTNLLETCRNFDSELTFAKCGTGINEMLVAYTRTGGVQRTINIAPNLIAGQPLRAVNVMVSTRPDAEIETARTEINNSVDKYMNDFCSRFLPPTSSSLLKNLITRMKAKDEAKAEEINETDGNLRFTLTKEIKTENGKQKLNWSLQIIDFKSYTESVAKELENRK